MTVYGIYVYYRTERNFYVSINYIYVQISLSSVCLRENARRASLARNSGDTAVETCQFLCFCNPTICPGKSILSHFYSAQYRRIDIISNSMWRLVEDLEKLATRLLVATMHAQGIFQDLELGGCQPTLGGPLPSPLPFPFSLPFPSLPPSPLPSLRSRAP